MSNNRTTGEGAVVAKARKTVTNWAAFKGLRPTAILCEGYPPVHTVNSGCHTKLLPDAKFMASHTFERGHGGGFSIWLEEGDTNFWEECEKLGLEIVDFRCGVCEKRLKPMAAAAAQHFRPHPDTNRKMQVGGLFLITVGNAPSVDDEAVELEG